MDRRLAAPFVADADSLVVLRGILHDALADVLARESAVFDWTRGTGDARFGLTPGRLHLGRFVVPLPVSMTSIQDADPRARQRQSMLREVRAQQERLWRDSVVSTRRRP